MQLSIWGDGLSDGVSLSRRCICLTCAKCWLSLLAETPAQCGVHARDAENVTARCEVWLMTKILVLPVSPACRTVALSRWYTSWLDREAQNKHHHGMSSKILPWLYSSKNSRLCPYGTHLPLQSKISRSPEAEGRAARSLNRKDNTTSHMMRSRKKVAQTSQSVA